MIIDKRLQVSSDQALTGTSAVASTDTIDLSLDRDIGPGQTMYAVIQFKAAPGGTTPTFTAKVQTDDNSAFSSATDLLTTNTLAAAAMAVGQRLVIPFPWTNERHVRLSYTMGGTSPTSTVDAWISSEPPPNWTAFADAI